jgi:hypothetical protein
MKRSKEILTKQTVILPDIHHPEHSKPAFNASISYIQQNRKIINRVVLLGDNMDCTNISRHTKGKPRLRTRGGINKDFNRFYRDILKPIEAAVQPGTELWFFLGNHEDWLEQWLDENPEFEGIVSFDHNLGLTKRGWTVIPQGEHRRVGKAYLVHGDQVGSSMHVAKKLVDTFCATAIMGHVHAASSYSKVSHVKSEDKWIGYTLPTLGTVAPKYAKGRPNAFTNGFGIVEVWPNDFINVYTAIIINGQFSFAGKLYSGV